ncbi:MAG: PilZ domain-containing protein [Vicinamibacterales bacterium]
MRSVGDRRNGVRFEVVGSFLGTFQATEASTRLIDLSELGALFESHLPLAVASVHSICLSVDGLTTATDAKVRHVSGKTNGAHNMFRIGVEFLESSTTFLSAVERLMHSRALPLER